MIYNLRESNFRQLRHPPRTDNAPTQRIREDCLPAMKIRVNAQVTFLISILEMICAFISLIVVIIFKTATFPVIISIMMSYLILLPSAFLMNTSNNKRRVIEHGWSNVLRNTFGLSPIPSNPDGNQGTKMNENKSSSGLKKGRNAVYPYKRDQVHSPIKSHDMGKSLPTGSTSTLVVATAEEPSDNKDKKQKKLLEIMMNPEKLERAYQMNRPKISSIGNRSNSVLECKANRMTKRRFSENCKIALSDLEQESEVLFGCK